MLMHRNLKKTAIEKEEPLLTKFQKKNKKDVEGIKEENTEPRSPPHTFYSSDED